MVNTSRALERYSALRIATVAFGAIIAWPLAASCQDVVVEIDVAMWNGHIDDCLNPSTNACQEAGVPGGVSADGVRNGIPAGGVMLIKPRVSIPVPISTNSLTWIADYTDAKDILALSTLLFDRRLTSSAFPANLKEGTAYISLHFPAGTTFSGLSQSCAPMGGHTPNYCISIPLTAAFSSGKKTSTIIHEEFALYTQAESVIAQSEALYLSLNP